MVVTVLADGQRIFAHTQGTLHCLDLANGQLLWSNELPGYGYGLASLCLPGGPTAPDCFCRGESASGTTAIERRHIEFIDTASGRFQMSIAALLAVFI